MKKIMSQTGMGAIAIALLMGSCVSQRKYNDAQSSIERYRADSAQWAQRSTSMQENMTTLEQKNKTMQKQWDSSQNMAKNQQERWSQFQSYYDQQKTSSEALHQKVHQALDNSGIVETNDVFTRNGNVYINLDESNLFTGSKLSAKGKQAISKLASVIKADENVVVNIATSTSYAAYWGDNNSDMNKMDKKSDMDKMDKKSSMNNANKDAGLPGSDNAMRSKEKDMKERDMEKSEINANIGDSSYLGSGGSKGTNKNADATMKKKDKMVEKNKSEAKERNMTFRPKAKNTESKSSSNPDWNSSVAKANALAMEFSENGVYQVNVSAPGSSKSASGSDKSVNTSANRSDNNRFQLILTSKNENYHQMMGQQGNKGVVTNK